MIETSLVLNESDSVLLDASGNGAITMGPGSAWERWEVERTSVNVSVGQPVPVCYILRGYSSDLRNVIDGTYTASLDTSTVAFMVAAGEKVTASFQGGSPGSVASVVFAGKKIVRGDIGYR